MADVVLLAFTNPATLWPWRYAYDFILHDFVINFPSKSINDIVVAAWCTCNQVARACLKPLKVILDKQRSELSYLSIFSG